MKWNVSRFTGKVTKEFVCCWVFSLSPEEHYKTSNPLPPFFFSLIRLARSLLILKTLPVVCRHHHRDQYRKECLGILILVLQHHASAGCNGRVVEVVRVFTSQHWS